MLRFIRFNSISTIKSRIISGEVPITKSLIDKSLQNNEFSELKSIITSNKSLLSNSLKDELANYITNDFSLYYLLKDHQWNTNQLRSLIAANPGRVDGAWDLYTRHGSPVDDEIINEMIKKLIEEEQWAKILYLYKKLQNNNEIEEYLFQKLIEVPEYLPFFEFNDEFLLRQIKQLEGLAFLNVFNKIYSKVDFETMAKGLDSSIKLDSKTPDNFIENYERLFDEKLSVSTPNIVDHVEANKLDTDKTPESLLVRMKLMEIYGMEQNDFEQVLKKFHHYQIHADFGIEIIQNLIIQAYCLKAFNESKSEILPIVDALMLENIPIKIIQALILTHAEFDTDKSLEIYNQYIQQVSTQPGESGRSSAGLLNESIMLAYLYNNDRDFATIIYDKIEASKLLSEQEVRILKQLFKLYGDAYEQDDWTKAKPILQLYIAKTIRNL